MDRKLKSNLEWPELNSTITSSTLSSLFYHACRNVSFQVRFVKSDNIWLSPNYQRDSCHITQLLYTPSEEIKQKYFSGFHHKMERFNGRPHWGKEFNVTVGQLKKLYPQFDNFLAMRQKMDPAGVFVNPFLSQQFQLRY